MNDNKSNINWEITTYGKHFRSLINKAKNIDFYLHILNKFY